MIKELLGVWVVKWSNIKLNSKERMNFIYFLIKFIYKKISKGCKKIHLTFLFSFCKIKKTYETIE